MMHCKQMKPISSANNTQQKGQQIKTTLNKKGNNMTSKFHKVVHGFAFDKGVVNESKKQVAITVSLQFDRVLSPFLKKSCSNLVVAGFLFFYWYILLLQLWAQGGGCTAVYSIECNFTLMMTLMTSKLMAMVMKMMMSALVASCLNILEP